MEKKFELLPPMMPNFVRLRQDGFKVSEGLPITDFTKKEAEEYGELMKQTFIAHWENSCVDKNRYINKKLS
jgi:hypothetical protein